MVDAKSVGIFLAGAATVIVVGGVARRINRAMCRSRRGACGDMNYRRYRGGPGLNTGQATIDGNTPKNQP